MSAEAADLEQSDKPADAAAMVLAGCNSSDNVRGALWVFASAFAFVVSVSLVKFLGRNLPPTLPALAHHVASLAVLLPWIVRNPVATFRTSRPGLIVGRSLATSLSMLLAFFAYQRLPLAEANALSFSRVLWLALLAVLFLGERLPPRRLLATLAGFGGVLIVLNPSGGAHVPMLPAAAGLCAALMLAASLTGVKSLTRDHGQVTLLAWSGLLGIVFTLPFALANWRTPSLHDALLLAVMGLSGAATQFCYVRGLAWGDATVVAPVDYSRIILSAGFGALFFSEQPPVSTLVGVAIIVGSTLYITWHASRAGYNQPVP